MADEVGNSLSFLFVFHFLFLHFLEQVGSENEVVELLVGGGHNLVLVAGPCSRSLVDEDDVLANAHH